MAGVEIAEVLVCCTIGEPISELDRDEGTVDKVTTAAEDDLEVDRTTGILATTH